MVVLTGAHNRKFLVVSSAHILVEDDPAWKELTDTAEALIRKSNTELCTTVILETVRQLEYLAKRRKAG